MSVRAYKDLDSSKPVLEAMTGGGRGSAEFNAAVNRRLRRRQLTAKWPFLVWLGIVALCSVLYVRSAQYGVLSGTVQAIVQDVAPLQTARLQEVYVKIGERVTNGQVVAQMETTLVDAQLAQAEAKLAEAQSSWASYEGQMIGLQHTLDDDVLKAQSTILQQQSQRDSDTARLAELKGIQAERNKSFQMKLIPESLANALRPEIAGLERTVAAFPARSAEAAQILESQRAHRADFCRSLNLGPDDDISKAFAAKRDVEMKVLSDAVEMRRRERESYSLRAATDGVISDIPVAPGCVIQPGGSVVKVVSKSNLIIGYLPELRLGHLKVGDRGYAFRMGRPTLKVEVVGIVPEINPVPAQLSPISAPLGVTFQSEKIVFRADETAEITAGEKVQIRMTSDWWARTRYWAANLFPRSQW